MVDDHDDGVLFVSGTGVDYVGWFFRSFLASATDSLAGGSDKGGIDGAVSDISSTREDSSCCGSDARTKDEGTVILGLFMDTFVLFFWKRNSRER